MNKVREIWVDRVKLFACILVVLGHFLQSMVKSEFLPDGFLFQWFNRTVYMFHVPLFFICSGYLYQKITSVDTWKSWIGNVLRKFISLGIPYLAFSIITWIFKNIFSSSVNHEADGLLHTLFVVPESPYWYLYVLFFFFVFIPTVKGKSSAYIISGIALTVKLLYEIVYSPEIYFVSGIMNNGIWFVLGMLLCIGRLPEKILNNKRNLRLGISISVLFITASVFVCNYELIFPCLDFVLGFAACIAVLVIVIYICRKGKPNAIVTRMASYTLPVFLLHTVFAAGFRIVLLKVGISNPVLHIVLGLCISFIGPILVAELAKRIKFLEFLFYPGKYIKITL